MKILITIVFTLSFLSVIQAQTKISRKIPVNKTKEIDIELPYASTIEVNSWIKNEVWLEANVILDSGKLDHHFELITAGHFNDMRIASTYGSLFKQEKSFFDFFSKKNEATIINVTGEEQEKHLTVDGVSIKENYKIIIPENIKLTLNSTAANITIAFFNGDLVVESVSGDIKVVHYHGDMSLKTVSGKIDIVVGKTTNIQAKTIVGKIYNEDGIPNLIIGEKTIGSFAIGKSTDSIHEITLTSVSGNIHLRN